MNKNTILSIIAGCFVFGAVTLGYLSVEPSYSPREKVTQGIDGYSSYMKLLRANQITGTVSNEDVAEVMSQIKAVNSSKYKTSWPVKWDFRGPDNVGGRTRAICLDRNDSERVWSGGVSGGLFTSENHGNVRGKVSEYSTAGPSSRCKHPEEFLHILFPSSSLVISDFSTLLEIIIHFPSSCCLLCGSPLVKFFLC
mgnify:CR=1 FL=1